MNQMDKVSNKTSKQSEIISEETFFEREDEINEYIVSEFEQELPEYIKEIETEISKKKKELENLKHEFQSELIFNLYSGLTYWDLENEFMREDITNFEKSFFQRNEEYTQWLEEQGKIQLSELEKKLRKKVEEKFYSQVRKKIIPYALRKSNNIRSFFSNFFNIYNQSNITQDLFSDRIHYLKSESEILPFEYTFSKGISEKSVSNQRGDLDNPKFLLNESGIYVDPVIRKAKRALDKGDLKTFLGFMDFNFYPITQKQENQIKNLKKEFKRKYLKNEEKNLVNKLKNELKIFFQNDDFHPIEYLNFDSLEQLNTIYNISGVNKSKRPLYSNFLNLRNYFMKRIDERKSELDIREELFERFKNKKNVSMQTIEDNSIKLIDEFLGVENRKETLEKKILEMSFKSDVDKFKNGDLGKFIVSYDKNLNSMYFNVSSVNIEDNKEKIFDLIYNGLKQYHSEEDLQKLFKKSKFFDFSESEETFKFLRHTITGYNLNSLVGYHKDISRKGLVLGGGSYLILDNGKIHVDQESQDFGKVHFELISKCLSGLDVIISKYDDNYFYTGDFKDYLIKKLS